LRLPEDSGSLKYWANHPYTAIMYTNIGNVYNGCGYYYASALKWYMKAAAIQEKVLDKDHHDTATTYNNIAVFYDNQGDYAKAMEWYLKSYRILRLKLGAEHPNTVLVKGNMETAYAAAGFKQPFDEWLREMEP
jgi:tetratricopeptide (TPR) repeat protein